MPRSAVLAPVLAPVRAIVPTIVLMTALSGGWPDRASAADEATHGVAVSVATASRRDVPEFVRGIGTVQAFRSVLVRARVDGTLEQIAYREGQTVKPGDLLAVIDPRPYAAALAQAQAKRAADAALLANARVDLTRYASLAASSYASRQQLDTQHATVAQDQANIQADDAAIATAELNLSFCRIESPIDGVVGLKLVDIGNLVHASDTAGLVTITQVKPISLVFTLPEQDFPSVQEARRSGEPPVLAYSSDAAKHLLSTGTLLTPNNTIDTATGTIQLKATFANEDEKLWPGQFVEARLRTGTAQNAVTVPPAAIQHGPDGLYVFTVGADSTVKRVPVTTAYEDDDAVVIKTGLAGGERVVTAGQLHLDDGTRVSAHDAAQDAGAKS